jgi:hypothetical protein
MQQQTRFHRRPARIARDREYKHGYETHDLHGD